MEGKVISFRRGRFNQRSNQVIIEVPGIDSREKASQLIGKKVVVKISEKVTRVGRITRLHGKNGLVVARFKRGLPAYVLLKTCEIT